ncbi:MAG: heparinase II/III family protein [Rhizobiaceae bacterium]|nr:heparinase II/III family protein [Rhizobiaceae bacterium]
MGERVLVARLALRRAAMMPGDAAAQLLRLWRDMTQRLPDAVDFPLKEIRPADPVIGERIYSGVFLLARQSLQTGDKSAFALQPPSSRFAVELHEFGWLRHIAAGGTELGSANARALLHAWLKDARDLPPVAWDDDVAARRLIALMAQDRLMLKGADAGFLALYLKTVARHLHWLQARLRHMRVSATRIRARIAIIEALMLLRVSTARLQRPLAALGNELARDVLADGGHVSRSPEVMIELLSDLIPLKLLLAAEKLPVPPPLVSAIDRMIPAVRFFRHMDGEPALFNGTGAILPDRLAVLFDFDDSGAAAPKRLAQSGFERLTMGGTAVIADAGPVPGASANPDAHAGTLSFEMSSGRHRYIVNAGVDVNLPDNYRPIWRQTVAHSTLAIDERSSTSFTGNARLQAALGTPVLTGAQVQDAERIDTGDTQGFRARHSGYVADRGVWHERVVTLGEGGNRISGTDRLIPVSGLVAPRGGAVSVRFHLHPDVHVLLDGNDQFMLVADGDDSWTFSCDGIEPKLIQTFFFARVTGATRSKAIQLDFDMAERSEVTWQMTRSGTRAR